MSTRKIKISGREITVDIRGSGTIPCMFVGAAGLFKKPEMMPSALDAKFTFYYVDLWDKETSDQSAQQSSYADLDWNKIAQEIDEARKRLGLEKVVVMGQSAAGAMPIEYARRYPGHCLMAVPVAFSPNWTGQTDDDSEKFIEKNADDNRKRAMNILSTEYETFLKEHESEEANFIQKFDANRPLYWKDYLNTGHTFFEYQWDGYHPDVAKVMAYINQALNGYDFFKNPVEDVPIFWCLGLYDYSAPVYLLTDVIERLHKEGSLKNVDYYVFDSGHYPMVESAEAFAEALANKAEELELEAKLTSDIGTNFIIENNFR